MSTISPLAKKLHVKPGQTWLILDAPEDYLATLEPLPEGVALTFEANGSPDGVQFFVRNSAELVASLVLLAPILKLETTLWCIYPKKNKGITTDLEIMGSWDVAKAYNLRPVTSAAINDVWTALRFRPDHLVQKSDSRKEAIQTNELSAYIDPKNKTVRLPDDAMAALTNVPSALKYFDKLAYSHKKEYAVWILTAKQDKTRTTRVHKMVEMLQNGKRNPTDK